MMREGFERTAPKPVHLEASTARSCAIYSHFFFEVDEEHVFGKGAVDSRGLPAKGSEATGYQDWVMTKVSTKLHIIRDSLILITVCSGNIDD